VDVDGCDEDGTAAGRSWSRVNGTGRAGSCGATAQTRAPLGLRQDGTAEGLDNGRPSAAWGCCCGRRVGRLFRGKEFSARSRGPKYVRDAVFFHITVFTTVIFRLFTP